MTQDVIKQLSEYNFSDETWQDLLRGYSSYLTHMMNLLEDAKRTSMLEETPVEFMERWVNAAQSVKLQAEDQYEIYKARMADEAQEREELREEQLAMESRDEFDEALRERHQACLVTNVCTCDDWEGHNPYA